MLSNYRLVRRIITTVALLLGLLGAAVGSGLIGTPIAESAGGALAADATLIAPATPAFRIWSVIYAGLLAYTIWQWFPRDAERQDALGSLPAWSLILNALWIFVAGAGVVWLSAVVIIALLVVLAMIMIRLNRTRPNDWIGRIVVDGTFGLYLGWVAVATCANITAALVAGGIALPAPLASAAGTAVVLVAGLVAILLARRFGGRITVGLAIAWGLAWIGVGRLIGEPLSGAVAIGAFTAAALALGSALLVRAMTPRVAGAAGH